MFGYLKEILTVVLAVCALGVFLPGFALAAEAPQTDDMAGDTVVFSNAQELTSTAEMTENRGAAGGTSQVNTITSAQTLAASTSGNSLSVGGNLTNGDIGIGDNLGGFGSYVMNTGNNSTITSAVSFNVQIMSSPTPAP